MAQVGRTSSHHKDIAPLTLIAVCEPEKGEFPAAVVLGAVKLILSVVNIGRYDFDTARRRVPVVQLRCVVNDSGSDSSVRSAVDTRGTAERKVGKSGLPVLAFNSLRTETEQSEHKGLVNLLKGLFGSFRNTSAHAPKIKWVIKEQDALDMLSLAPSLQRRLDDAVEILP